MRRNTNQSRGGDKNRQTRGAERGRGNEQEGQNIRNTNGDKR